MLYFSPDPPLPFPTCHLLWDLGGSNQSVHFQTASSEALLHLKRTHDTDTVCLFTGGMSQFEVLDVNVMHCDEDLR